MLGQKDKMLALFCYGDNDFRIEEMEKPCISNSDMLIEMLYCSLCRSDVIKIFDSTVRKPDIYGHEVVGRVVEVGSNVTNFKIGDVVASSHHIPCGNCHFCRHGNHTMCSQYKETNFIPGGFSQYIKLSDKHIDKTTFKLPENFDSIKALFMEPLACSIRAMNRISRLPSDIFSVTGAGSMGILFLQLLKLEGLKVVVLEIDSQRLDLAKKLGADLTINPSCDLISNTIGIPEKNHNENMLSDKISKIFPAGIDTAILTFTNEQTVSNAMLCLKPGGSINIFARSEDNNLIPLDFSMIYKNELTLRSTYGATPETTASAFKLIMEGKVEVSPLISKIFNLSEFKQGLDMMLSKKIYKAIYRL